MGWVVAARRSDTAVVVPAPIVLSVGELVPWCLGRDGRLFGPNLISDNRSSGFK